MVGIYGATIERRLRCMHNLTIFYENSGQDNIVVNRSAVYQMSRWIKWLYCI